MLLHAAIDALYDLFLSTFSSDHALSPGLITRPTCRSPTASSITRGSWLVSDSRLLHLHIYAVKCVNIGSTKDSFLTQVSDFAVLFGNMLDAKVHLDNLEAGANIILTASYQATIQGFEAKGLSREEAENLLKRSVEIACEAREIYEEKCTKDSLNFTENGRITTRPVLVAASVGSYGAYLVDGSEYSGDYGDAISLETSKEFHRRRVQILANSGVDIIAFETIPNKLEAKAYAELLEEENITTPARFSFNSKDGINVVSGDPMADCASIVDLCKQVAVGINCTPPRYIHGLITSIMKVIEKPVLVYPNSGETYDADRKEWVPSIGAVDEDFVSYVGKWCETGASLFGGCCRTIRAISRALSNKSSACSTLSSNVNNK